MKHQLSVENEEALKRRIPLAVARAASKCMETSSQLSSSGAFRWGIGDGCDRSAR
jgi:hypothetical protein